MDDHDRWRFVHDLWQFNTTDNVTNLSRTLQHQNSSMKKTKMSEVGPLSDDSKLVCIHAWCLMHNHYHLLLSACIDNGISEFLKKLNVGYTLYFNERHSRSGVLFQGKTKKKRIDSEAYFLHIFNYIHLNPLDYLEGAREWRSGIITAKEARQFLASYRWSSYYDYYEGKNIPSVLDASLFQPMLREGMFDLESLLEEYRENAALQAKSLWLE